MLSSFRLLTLAAACAAGAAVSSCAVGSSTTTRSVDDIDQEVSVGTSYSVHGSQPSAWLEQARQHARDARFGEAKTLFQRVYDSSSAKPDQKASALLGLGRVHANVLNPNRSDEKARAYFERVVREFPDTEQRQEAEDRLDDLGPSE